MLEVGDFVIFKDSEPIGNRFKNVIYELKMVDSSNTCRFQLYAKLPKADAHCVEDPRGHMDEVVTMCNKVIINKK